MSAKVVVISGPSGVGKTTVCEALLERPEFRRVVTATTRPPRPGESDGVDYHFLDEPTFREGIASGRFLEHAEVFGRLYGTPRESVEAILGGGRSVLLNIDVQGAETLRHQVGLDILTVFIQPPSFAVLEQRLRARGTDSDEVIERRLEEARRELAQADLFDLVVTNAVVEDCVAEICRSLDAAPSDTTQTAGGERRNGG